MSSLSDLSRSPPGTTLEQKLWRYNLSSSDLDDLQISKIHLHSDNWVALDFWAAVFKQTLTPNLLRSFSVFCDRFTTEIHSPSTIFDLLHDAAPTLAHITLGASHTTRWNSAEHGFFEDVHDNQCAYHEFDSHEMRTRLAPGLTSLRSLTLEFQFHPPARSLGAQYVLSPYEAFTRMAPILASFPTCLERITLSFASTGLMLVDSYHAPYTDLHGGSWLWPELNLPLLVPWLRRYEQLNHIVFEGPAEGVTTAERARILTDLAEFSERIEFVD